MTKTNVNELQNKAESNKIILSNERITKLGEQLSEILHELEMQNHVINFIPNPRKVKDDSLFYYNSVYQALETFYETNQNNIKKIDAIAFILQNLTDKEELEAVGEHIVENE